MDIPLLDWKISLEIGRFRLRLFTAAVPLKQKSANSVRWVYGIAGALGVLSVGVLAAVYESGQLDLWRFLTEFALVLVTIALSLIIVNNLLPQLNQRAQERRARIPLERIAESVGVALESVIKLMSEILAEENFVSDMLMSDGLTEATMSEQLVTRPGAPDTVPADPVVAVFERFQRSAEDISIELRMALPVFDPEVAGAIEEKFRAFEGISETRLDGTAPPSGGVTNMSYETAARFAAHLYRVAFRLKLEVEAVRVDHGWTNEDHDLRAAAESEVVLTLTTPPS